MDDNIDFNPKFHKRRDYKGFTNGNTVRRDPNYRRKNSPKKFKYIVSRKIDDPLIIFRNGEYFEYKKMNYFIGRSSCDPNIIKQGRDYFEVRKIDDPTFIFKNEENYEESDYWSCVETIPRRYDFCTRCNQRPCLALGLEAADRWFQSRTTKKNELIKFATKY